MRKFLVLAFLVLLGAKAPKEFSGIVSGVHDGDTITVGTTKVRLLGVDAPELKQPGGIESRDWLVKLVKFKEVTIRWHNKDRYGRTVGEVLIDGKSANAGLVASGHAFVYRSYPHPKQYETLEAQAKGAKRGIWSSDSVQAPWEFRREQKAARKVAQ